MIGRTDADWNVPWDSMISRAHVRLLNLTDGRVEVRCMASARNPVFHRGSKAPSLYWFPGNIL